VVDDSIVHRRVVGRIVEESCGYKIVYAKNGLEALAALQQQLPSVVLTDLHMPEMDGLALVENIRARYPLVPVVLMTSDGSEDIALQALRNGASSYIPKRSLEAELGTILPQVVAATKVIRHRHLGLDCLTYRKSHFRLAPSPALVPAVLVMLQEDLAGLQSWDETARLRMSMALKEALDNALYHGTLELGAALHQKDAPTLKELVAQRCQMRQYRDRGVYVQATLLPSEATFVIRDEGPGFNFAALPDPKDPANLSKGSRGLLLIRTFMDNVLFNQSGNQITLIKRRDQSSVRRVA
jgi:CheY-like chemotaxis protein